MTYHARGHVRRYAWEVVQEWQNEGALYHVGSPDGQHSQRQDG